MSKGQPIEVNGKIDLGTRKLCVTFVENACSFYAHQESQRVKINEIKKKCNEVIRDQPTIKSKPQVGQVVGISDDQGKYWLRGVVDEVDKGPNKKLIRVRTVDIGWNKLVSYDILRDVTPAIKSENILCEKYKLAGLKPKGRDEGYSMDDRQQGADWLRYTIKNKPVLANCYRQVKYAGGIQADCMVGDLNLNKAAMMVGHVVINPHGLMAMSLNPMGGGGPNVGGMGIQMNEPFGVNQQQLGDGGRHNKQGMDMNRREGGGKKMINNVGGGMPMGVSNNSNTNIFRPPTVDFDYRSYNDSYNNFAVQSLPSFTGSAAANGFGNKQTGAGKQMTEEVKRLEKKLREDQKRIDTLKKTTNIDTGIKDVVKLGRRVAAARRAGTENKVAGGGQARKDTTLASVVGVPEVLEDCMDVVDVLDTCIRAVATADSKLCEEQSKAKLISANEADQKAFNDNLESLKIDLLTWIDKYFELYQENAVEDILGRVTNQLDSMEPNIPGAWKMLEPNAEKITRTFIQESIAGIKAWIEESASKEATVRANSQKEVEMFCSTLNEVSKGLMSLLEEGNQGQKVDIPYKLDSQLEAAKQALLAELTARKGPSPAAASAKKKGGAAGDGKSGKAVTKDTKKEVAILKSAWKCLYRLQTQIKQFKAKVEEFEQLQCTLTNRVKEDSVDITSEPSEEDETVSLEK